MDQLEIRDIRRCRNLVMRDYSCLGESPSLPRKVSEAHPNTTSLPIYSLTDRCLVSWTLHGSISSLRVVVLRTPGCPCVPTISAYGSHFRKRDSLGPILARWLC